MEGSARNIAGCGKMIFGRLAGKEQKVSNVPAQGGPEPSLGQRGHFHFFLSFIQIVIAPSQAQHR